MTKIWIEGKHLTCHPSHKDKPLYHNLNITCSDTTHVLIGDNGSGKSTLARTLAQPSSQVRHYGAVGYLSQELQPFSGTVADKLQVSELLKAIGRVEQGKVHEKDFELLENNWDIKTVLEKQFDHYQLPMSILDQPYVSLSGGMRSRLHLLNLERQACDFYILDEPSNHLDRKSKRWLIDWIASHSSCLIISHDLTLLETSQIILELDSKGLHLYRGGWQDYLTSKKQLKTEIEKKFAQSEKILHAQRKAKQKNQEKLESKQQKARKARQQTGQSKLVLNKKKEVSETTGSRLAMLHDKRVSDAQETLNDAKHALSDVYTQAFMVSLLATGHKQTLCLTDIVLPYGNQAPVNFQLVSGEHLWLTGDNGSGKSTLLNVIQGKVEPLSGSIIKPKSIALLDQHFSFLHQSDSVLDNFSRLAPGLTQSKYRTILSQLRMRREAVLQPISTLSGGETLKLALACLFSGTASPALLLLDEPDNHLDLNSKQLLIHTLKQYQGSLIIVSHDEKFIESINIFNQYKM